MYPSRIYCARPGSRIWEVDVEGEIVRTHQFKADLACAPSKIYKGNEDANSSIGMKFDEKNSDLYSNDDTINAENDGGNDEMLEYQPQNLQFSKLYKLNQQGHLLAFNELGIYIFDMRTSTLILWCNQFERIVDAHVMENEGDIVIFTQTGSLYSIQLQTLQYYARKLISQDKLHDCACLMRKNVKYFADKAHEDYELNCCNRVKNYLMQRHQYELLNDLSVIFDAVALCESSGDNNSSSGASTGTAGDRNSNIIMGAIANPATITSKSNSSGDETSSHNGLFVLENSFCDNLKCQKRSTESQLKEALLTVTGKFGKNIIKYKFNVFQKDQQQVVQDLIPAPTRSMPFSEMDLGNNADVCGNDDICDGLINDAANIDSREEEIVCDSRNTPASTSAVHYSSVTINKTKENSTNIARANSKSNSNKITIYPSLTAEQKTIYNLYLICKSSKIGKINFLERYRKLFDEYTAPELIRLLEKLVQLMIDHGDDRIVAQCHCYEMYFHYLNPELIWEMDNASRDYIAEGFKLLNTNDDIIRCVNCNFPLRFDNNCYFHALGAVLIRYYWSRHEQFKCFDILNAVPSLYDVMARLYLAEGNTLKVLSLILAYGQPELLMEMGRTFTLESWTLCFELFVEMQLGRVTCVQCACLTTVANIGGHFFYTWNCFLNIALEYIDTKDLLDLVLKWSQFIPNDAIDRDFYMSCLLKG